MPTPLVADNAALLKVLWDGPTRGWINVFGLAGTGAFPTVDQILANDLFTGITASPNTSALLALMSDTTALRAITIRDIRTAGLAEFTSAGTAVPGAGAGDALPLSLASVVTIRTARAGKSFRGRSFLAGFTENQNDTNGRVAAAVNTAGVAFLTAINSVLAGHGLTMGVLHRPQAGRTIPARTIPASIGFVTPVSSFEARDTRWESQRRRTGRN